MNIEAFKPSRPFVIISIVALLLGIGTYCIGLLNAPMELNEKGYYLAVLLYSLYAGISVQKTIRDRLEGLPVNNTYHLISVASVAISILLLGVGLFNAELQLNEKGFFLMAYILSLFASIAVQKNVRDLDLYNRLTSAPAESQDIIDIQDD